MAVGLLGKKLGMTRLFDEFGQAVAVTVVEAGPCTVVQVKSPEKDGYRAIQVGYEPVEESRVTKPVLGQAKKTGTTPFRYLREFRIADGEEFAVGQQLTVELFQDGEIIDVTGTSIGKGFQGGVKRWHWKGGPATHGSMSHRAPGSIGSSTDPARVWKGHHLPGHMGDDRVTVQNLRIMKRDPDVNLLVIEGAIPGPEQRLVIIRKSVKKSGKVVPRTRKQVMQVKEESAAAKKVKAGLKQQKKT